MVEEQSLAHPPPNHWSTGQRVKLALGVVAILACVVFAALCKRHKIPTGAMEPSVLVGDHIVSLRLDRPWSGDASSTVRRGDIITFWFPLDPSREFLMRVIGLPGESIRIEEDRVFVDGAELDEPYVMFSPPTGEVSRGLADLPKIAVPDGRYFVLGDNRDNSHDSRYWGFVPSGYVTGRVLFVYWSYDAQPYVEHSAGWERISALLRVMPEFFARTRWDRFFHNLSAR